MISGDLYFINHMARYRRYRRTIIRAPKKKWASNYVGLDSDEVTYGTDGSFVYSKPLAGNAVEGIPPTPVIVKTGNFKVQFDLVINVAVSSIASAQAYVIFIPEGYFQTVTPTTNMWLNAVTKHPEWIMMWRQLDFGAVGTIGSIDTSVVKMSSRMKRNLNSGDQIYFLILGLGEFAGVTQKAAIRGAAQFWTCAN